MSDVPEQKYPPCATCDTTLLPDKHHLCASDAVTDGDVTKEAREQIIREAMRSAGHDNDDKGLDWRTMSVMEHKVTLERAVSQEDVRPIFVYFQHGSDVKADQLDKDLTEYEVRPVLMKCKTRSAMGMSKQDTWKMRDLSTLGGSAVAEFVTGAFLGPCEKLDDETDVVNGLFLVFSLTFRLTPCNMVKISVQQRMAETSYQCLVTTPSEMSIDVIQMLSLVHDIATVVVSLTDCPDSEFILESYLKDPKRMRSNTTITGDRMPFFACQACPRTRTTSLDKWQIPTTHQPNGKYMCGDYTTESEKENDDRLEKNFMTIYLKTINGKTIRSAKPRLRNSWMK